MGRLFSDTSSVNAEPSRTVSTSISEAVEPMRPSKPQQESAQPTATRQEVRGSLIIHHDIEEENDNVESASNGGDSMMDLSEDSFATTSSDHDTRIHVEEPPKPLNEITEVEEEEDEVVTVLKTPHANPLAKANIEETFMESPLAGKSVHPFNRDMDIEGSDKENMPVSSLREGSVTPRLSSQLSESYVTARSDVPSEDPPEPEPEPQAIPTKAVDNRPMEEQQNEEIIETQVPIATSPKHEMHLPSLPTRAPLNMKKSFGVRKSHRTSLMETLARRSSVVPGWKALFGQPKETTEQPTTSTAPESTSKPAEQPASSKTLAQPVVTPTEEVVNTVVAPPMAEEPPRKEKDDTITIIDTELHLGEQRLKTKFTTDSQRIHDALNSLRTKSTPGQALREAGELHERILEAETPAPVRINEGAAIEADDEEEWIPKKDYTSLTQRLAKEQAEILSTENNHETQSVKAVVTKKAIQDETPPEARPVASSANISPPTLEAPPEAAPATSPSALSFMNAAAQAAEVIRNAMAFITNASPTAEASTTKPQPSPTPAEKPTNLYPRLNDEIDEPMMDIQVNENFSVHYNERESLESRADSTYFTQSEGPSQRTQTETEGPSQPAQASQPPIEQSQSHTSMPPPKKDQSLAKPKPVVMRVQTASQRSKEQQKKAQTTTQGTGIYPTLTSSKSVPDLATPAKMAREEARMSSVSVQSTGTYMKGTGQIKALNAAKLAKQKVI